MMSIAVLIRNLTKPLKYQKNFNNNILRLQTKVVSSFKMFY